MKRIVFTHPNHSDAQVLLEELSATLSGITGDSGKSSFNAQAFDPTRDAFLKALFCPLVV